jgi:hypothetical protein
MTTITKTAEQLRLEAKAHDAEAIASFERCDTDGALSQWSSGLNAQRARLQADIVDAGGVAKFPALFTLDGEYVPAKRIEGQWGPRWMVLDADGNRTGEYLPYFPKRRDTLAKKGYVEGFVLRPARADYAEGRGGLVTVYVTSKATDGGWVTPVSIVTADRWADA